MAAILVLHGPNLNLLGTREPEIYGSETLDEINHRLQSEAERAGASLTCLQSNSEQEMIEAIHQARADGTQFIIINPAAFTHTSVALRDALALFKGGKIEIHLSNTHKRETFRHHSMISAVVNGVVMGFGAMSYIMAVRGVVEIARETETHG